MNRTPLLPKVILDLIGEYNADHRPKMSWVLRDILKISHRKKFYWTLRSIVEMEYCDHCDKFLTGRIYAYRNCYHYQFCSSYCIDNFEYATSYY